MCMVVDGCGGDGRGDGGGRAGVGLVFGGSEGLLRGPLGGAGVVWEDPACIGTFRGVLVVIGRFAGVVVGRWLGVGWLADVGRRCGAGGAGVGRGFGWVRVASVALGGAGGGVGAGPCSRARAVHPDGDPHGDTRADSRHGSRDGRRGRRCVTVAPAWVLTGVGVVL